MRITPHLRIRTRLALAFFIVLTLMAASGVASLQQAARINASAVLIAESWLPSIQLLGDLRAQATLTRQTELRHLLAAEPAQKGEHLRFVTDADTRFQSLMVRYRPLVLSTEEQRFYDRLASCWKAYLQSLSMTLHLSEQGEGGRAQARTLPFGEGLKRYEDLQDLIEQDILLNRQGAQQAARQAENDYQHAKAFLAGFVVLSLLCSATLGLALTRSVTRPLGAEPGEINELMAQLAAGDLRAIPPPRTLAPHSVLAAVIRLQTQLGASLEGVRRASDAVVSATEQIAQGNAELASRTEDQTMGLQQTAAAIEQLTAAVQGNAEHA
ncbi:MAG: MCP four helix bundle domain-containing protein, partial [Curvibacter sp.]|nr:MCP four helix bundle domain-containing protein [Curvibacter sp.]